MITLVQNPQSHWLIGVMPKAKPAVIQASAKAMSVRFILSPLV
jgi:hypothetical protein